ncbi:SDR family NAD(P)-dependent oxidoreductase [Streptomyces avidinii]|uniref:SDR family NAD(P)-dependent oxidoreductase n=1 Tax=Streptomyces avidinii TaxID=1895 RepID=UPI0037ADB904
MSAPLTGRTALVTGATGGIGTAVVQQLAANGAIVVIAHHNEPKAAAELAVDIGAGGGRAFALEADLRHKSAVDELYAQATARLGAIDILVSNAGSYPRATWAETTPTVWNDMLSINLTSHYLLARAVSPAMAARGRGRIITMGSVLATVGRQELSAYISAKAGVEGLTRALARELGPSGITVNCVAPGSIQVPAEQTVVGDPEAMTVRQLARQCIQRRGAPTDVAAAVTFLAGEDAGFITGQTIHVDGGWVLG